MAIYAKIYTFQNCLLYGIRVETIDIPLCFWYILVQLMEAFGPEHSFWSLVVFYAKKVD